MKRFVLFLIVVAMLTACGGEPAVVDTPTAEAIAEATATETAPPPPTWTPTAVPTAEPTAIPTPAPTATPVPNDVWVSSAAGLNMRAEAKAGAQLVMTLKDKQHLIALGQPVGPDAGGITWQNVQTDDGKTGWVSAQYLTKTNPAAPAPAATPVPVATTAPAATPAPATVADAYVTSPDGLNLRAQASTTATVVVVIPFGAHVTSLSAPAPADAAGIAWQNVRTDDGKTGFVAASFLSATKPTTATVTATVTGTTPVATPIVTSTPAAGSLGTVYVIATNGLNLRAQPATTAAVVVTLTYGQRLTTLAAKSAPDAAGISWQNVRTDAGQAGYAAADYLSATAPTTATTTVTGTTTATPAAGANVQAMAAELVRRINELRAQNGVGTVAVNSQLTTAALRHSQDMAKTGNIAHVGSDGSTPAQRMAAAGYPGRGTDEVIYGGRATVDDVWYFWTNDRMHANVILNSKFAQVGVSVVNVGDRYYFTADFGGS